MPNLTCDCIPYVHRLSFCWAVRWVVALFILLTGCTPHPQSVVPRFRDVTKSAGIRFTHTSGASDKKYLVETMGAGGAFFDYDNDGWLDVLLLNGKGLEMRDKGLGMRDNAETKFRTSSLIPHPSSSALYRNNRNGTFTDVTRGSGVDVTLYAMGCAVGDYDNDGKDDIYITCALGPSRLFHNEGRGKFKDVTLEAGVSNTATPQNPEPKTQNPKPVFRWGTSCAWLDYDRDGDLDLYVANYVRYRSLADDIPCIVRGNRRSYCIPAAYAGSSGVLYRNNGDETFTDVTRAVGLYDADMKALGVAVCDYDDDGWLDIAVANDTVRNRLYHNIRGKFVEVAEVTGIAYSQTGHPRAGMGIDAADWRNDGTLTVAITNFPREAIGFHAQQAPRAETLTDMSQAVGIAAASLPHLGFGIRFLDYDNDGYRDLVAVNGHVQDDVAELESGQAYAQPALLYHNEQGKAFQEVSARAGAPFITPLVGRGLAAGDYDNDGRVDLLVTTNNGPAYLWRNETPTQAHWLSIKLEGRKGKEGEGSGRGEEGLAGTHRPYSPLINRARSNSGGIGARVSVKASGLEQRAWAGCASSYLSQSDLRVHFGMGQARTADLLTVRWTSGTVDTLRNVRADQVVTVREGESLK